VNGVPAPKNPLRAALDGLDEAGASYVLIVSYEQGTGELFSNTADHPNLAAVLRQTADHVEARGRSLAN
jgi:hypothetical protein